MDRSYGRRSSRDSSPLLPFHARSSSYPLADLDPRPYTDGSLSESPPRSSQESQTSVSPPSREPSRHSRIQFLQPPPPIASVILAPASSSIQPRSLSASRHLSSNTPNNPLTALVRRERSLQADFQILLDAQSTGLLQGRSRNDDASSEAGSSTPTLRSRSRSHDGVGVVPVRQPRKKNLSLKGARRGILNTMMELGAVKEHEADILENEKKHVAQVLRQVERWETKINRFDAAMGKIDISLVTREEKELKAERKAVEGEIRELEERLMGLKARDRILDGRIKEIGNRKEAELSSFREGKRDVEREVGEWLKRPTVRDIASMVSGLTVSGVGNEDDRSRKDTDETIPFLTLPPQRRTLPLATSWLTSSLSSVNAFLESISHEHEALLAGSVLWSETIDMVSTFEEDLRRQMKQGAADGKDLTVEDMKNQLLKMEDVVTRLELKEAKAKTEGWNLLICAMGAELEAFREGESLLRSVLKSLDPGAIDEEDNREESFLTAPLTSEEGDNERDHNKDHDQESIKVEVEGLQDLSKSARETKRAIETHRYTDESPAHSDSEDDGPPQALLVGLEEDHDGHDPL